MHFLIRETLSFNLMHVAACYPVGTTISKTSSLFTALLQHYNGHFMISFVAITNAVLVGILHNNSRICKYCRWKISSK